jgi:hypothetical protein
VRWGKQPGYVVFAGQKIPLRRPRVRTREGQEVELESYGQLQQDGKLQRAVRERLVAGLSTRNYRRAVESVVEGYGIEKSSVSRQFVAASCNQLRVLCERRLEDLNLVVLMIDGIHFGGQVLVVALGIAETFHSFFLLICTVHPSLLRLVLLAYFDLCASTTTARS